MSPSDAKPSSSQYVPLSLGEEEGGTDSVTESRSSDHFALLPEESANLLAPTSANSSQLPRLILFLSFALALLSSANIALLPATVSNYHASLFSDSGLDALPNGDARLGLDRVGNFLPPPQNYQRAWPDRIVRVSRKLKNAVWGDGVQVYVTVEVRISFSVFTVSLVPFTKTSRQFQCIPLLAQLTQVKDSTIMRFPIPSTGANACALYWRPPPESSPRVEDLTTKGDITEIEVWQLIAPSATDSSSMETLDYDALSYSTLPVRGELLGVLDLTAKPNSTTVQFACPSETESLVVEMKCQRVACHVSFLQIDMAPRFGFELLRRRE
ncbi:hypothetical protein NQ176_g985 [Zarea fungicola]|uniref:Uncharacterized protein n=1 Tax=Zarea fungicola TaxID=93591 RepID=A0ACC1NVT6_9HYPO|nr:hypothetical protein NQ176_g985 [Lecanicillium fungicola]